jgi:ATP-binding cassette subfamily B protein
MTQAQAKEEPQNPGTGKAVEDLSWRELWDTARRSFRLCRDTSASAFSILIAGSIASSFLPAGLAAMAGLVVNHVQGMMSSGDLDLTSLLPWLGGFATFTFASGGLQAVRAYGESILSAEMDRVMSKKVLEHRVTLDMAFYELPENHDLVQRGTAFAGREFLRFIMQTITLGSLAIQFVTLLAVMMYILPVVTPLLGVLAAPMIYFRWRISKMQYKLNHQKTSRMRLRNYYAGDLTKKDALPSIKFFALGSVLSKRFDSLSRELIAVDRGLFRRRAIGQIAGSIAFAIVSVVAAGWAANAALTGALAIGALVTYLASADRLRGCINDLTNSASTVFTNVLFVRNLYLFFDAKPTIQIDSGLQPAEAHGRIELRDVCFSYPGTSSETIQHVDLEILPGETVALVGANGAGKSTLANLITRLHDPTSGTVLIDGIDARELSADWLYRQIAYVGQRTLELEVSAAENIAFGDLERLDGQPERIAEIARNAGIQSIIDKMPRGLDTVLGRRFGEYALSGGEWQRLSVARALAKNAPILVFDEPTANMDARAEYELFTALKEMVKERTTIIISHRFATVRSADRIVVLDEGRIAEVGSHDELIRLGRIYAGLYTIQQQAMNG